MARKMAEVVAASERSQAMAEEARMRNERAKEREQMAKTQEQEQRQAERVAAKVAGWREKAERESEARVLAQARAILAKRGQVAETQPLPYVDGDGLSHATGKRRLGVERGDGCVCGCGQMPEKKRSRFVPGHDARMYKLAKALRGKLGEDEQREARANVDERQLAYLRGRNLV